MVHLSFSLFSRPQIINQGMKLRPTRPQPEVIPDLPFLPTSGGERGGSWGVGGGGSRGQGERARGPPNGLPYSTEAEIKPLLREDRERLSLAHTKSERKQKSV